MIVDSTPLPTADLPFTNETEVQDFIERHTQQLFGLQVIASSRPGGRCLFDIDLLAIDGIGSPVIIECKWDLVDQSAIEQLLRYEDALTAGWSLFEARVGEATNGQFRTERRKPLLVAIGYRYELPMLKERHGVLCLAYRYHDIEVDEHLIEKKSVGAVSVVPTEVSVPLKPHPVVSKKHYTSKRLEPLPRALQDAFWFMDRSLRELDGVTVLYGGKNFVRYRCRHGRLAEAAIGSQGIVWAIERQNPEEKEKREMRHPDDASEILAVLLEAYSRAG